MRPRRESLITLIKFLNQKDNSRKITNSEQPMMIKFGLLIQLKKLMPKTASLLTETIYQLMLKRDNQVLKQLSLLSRKLRTLLIKINLTLNGLKVMKLRLISKYQMPKSIIKTNTILILNNHGSNTGTPMLLLIQTP